MRGVKEIKIKGNPKMVSKNCYYINVSFNIDGKIVTEEMGPFTILEMSKIKDVIEVVNTCMYDCPNGVDDYDLVDGFDEWFYSCEEEQSIMMATVGGVCGKFAPFAGVEVKFYYDDKPYDCEIIWEGEV